MKTIEFTLPLFSLAPPYHQLAIMTNLAGEILGTFAASTVPNPQRPNMPDRPNLNEYPIICSGQYQGHYSVTGHKQSRPAIVLENNGDIPIYQKGNPRFPDQDKAATYIHIHEGYTDAWRGSAGCPTLAELGGQWMDDRLEENEKIVVIIPDPFWFAFEGK